MALIGAAGAALLVAVPGDVRDEVLGSFLIAVAIQAPLGWWTVRSIGTPRFQLVWSVGMLIRLAVLTLAGVALVPALGWRIGPALGTLVAVMVGLLLVEAVTAAREHSWDRAHGSTS
jgi:heme A synthase